MASIEIELHVPDFGPVKDFYSNMGFSLAWEDHRSDSQYLVFEHKNTSLRFMLWKKPHSYFGEDDGRRGHGVELVISVDDLDAVYAKALTTQQLVTEMRLRPWGLRDFRMRDPFGYYLRFTELHDVLSVNYQGRPERSASSPLKTSADA